MSDNSLRILQVSYGTYMYFEEIFLQSTTEGLFYISLFKSSQVNMFYNTNILAVVVGCCNYNNNCHVVL